MKNNLSARLSSFARDSAGNFGVLTALLLVPLIGVAGLAVDVGIAVDERQALMNAADSAALGALSEKSASVAQALAMSSDGEILLGNEDGKRLFLAQLPQGMRDRLKTVSVSIKRKGAELTSTVNFTAAIPTSFLGVLGKNSISLGGGAKAVYQTNAFIDFFMLLDNTPSMGLGATDADIAKLKANTSQELRVKQNAPDGCAFACHATNSQKPEENTLDDARGMGVKLRIDVVRDATLELTKDVEKFRQLNNQYQMAVYSFGTSADDIGLKEVSRLTANMENARTSTGTLDLMSTRNNNYLQNQLTDFRETFDSLRTKMGTPGTGLSASDRQKIMFLVSDGVTDADKPDCSMPLKDTRCMEPIDPAFCKKLKDANIKVAVVYTTYIPLPGDGFWEGRIKPFNDRIRPSMEACSTPGYFIEASPSEDLGKAMQTLFRKLLNSPRLTS